MKPLANQSAPAERPVDKDREAAPATPKRYKGRNHSRVPPDSPNDDMINRISSPQELEHQNAELRRQNVMAAAQAKHLVQVAQSNANAAGCALQDRDDQVGTLSAKNSQLSSSVQREKSRADSAEQLVKDLQTGAHQLRSEAQASFHGLASQAEIRCTTFTHEVNSMRSELNTAAQMYTALKASEAQRVVEWTDFHNQAMSAATGAGVIVDSSSPLAMLRQLMEQNTKAEAQAAAESYNKLMWFEARAVEFHKAGHELSEQHSELQKVHGEETSAGKHRVKQLASATREVAGLREIIQVDEQTTKQKLERSAGLLNDSRSELGIVRNEVELVREEWKATEEKLLRMTEHAKLMEKLKEDAWDAIDEVDLTQFNTDDGVERLLEHLAHEIQGIEYSRIGEILSAFVDEFARTTNMEIHHLN